MDGTLAQLVDLIYTLNVQHGQMAERIKELEAQVAAVMPKESEPGPEAPPSSP